MKLGIYGGTFDPIHHGHLILAREALEQFGLSRIIFVPNVISPHKLARQPAPAEVRAAMVAAAIADEPGFEMDDSELGRGGTSYTIDTVLHLRERFPDADLHYIIGHDNLAELHTWRRIDDLLQLVRFIVLNRHDGEDALPHLTLRRRVDISATDIRCRAGAGLSIRYLVPGKVRALIEQHQLYRETPRH